MAIVLTSKPRQDDNERWIALLAREVSATFSNFNKITMNKYPGSEYDVKALVEYIGHPIINTAPKMFKFLRITGVLEGMTPNPILKRRGLLWDETRNVTQGVRSRPFQKVLFSESGRDWVMLSLAHYYGGEDEDPESVQKSNSRRGKGWEPFALRNWL